MRAAAPTIRVHSSSLFSRERTEIIGCASALINLYTLGEKQAIFHTASKRASVFAFSSAISRERERESFFSSYSLPIFKISTFPFFLGDDLSCCIMPSCVPRLAAYTDIALQRGGGRFDLWLYVASTKCLRSRYIIFRNTRAFTSPDKLEVNSNNYEYYIKVI